MNATYPDLRALALAVVAWVIALATWAGARGPVAVLILVGGCWALHCWRRQRSWTALAAAVLVAGAAFGSVVLHQSAIEESPVHRLASRGASVTAEVVLRSDPVRSPGRFGSTVWAEADVVDLTAQGRRFQLEVPVLLVLPASSAAISRGTTLRVAGSLRPSDRPERAAVLAARRDPEMLASPSMLTAIGNRLRHAIRVAVAEQSPAPRALVPALVDGEDGGLSPQIVEDFRTTGMTHLLAVSGTNLTLIVGFLLVLARWAGVRARGLIGVGILGVGGFLLLAGAEPSVLRAAAMGVIALIGLGNGGRQRGVRALGVGVLVLIVIDPTLARSIGFALSVAATAAILLLVPRWREALGRWLPRWLAEAIAVPLAAQLACTPLVAAISGQVSLVAVAANVLAAPLVAPATVFGLVAGLVALVWTSAGQLLVMPAGWAATGLVAIAEHAAALPVPALGWSGSAGALVTLTVFCVGVAAVMHRLLIRRWATVSVAGFLAAAMLVPLPTPGWPAAGWVMVACAVGQGDALVLRVAEHSAVVVDAGPDPRLIDRCLRRLAIRVVPAVVLTHFHADHLDGLSGVVKGRRVGQILTSPRADPLPGAEAVQRLAKRIGVPVRAVVPGESADLGALHWQVLAPFDLDYPDSDSAPNDASVVMLVQVSGVRILLMGDQERPSQAALRRQFPDLRADVLKVAHHGSSKQDADLIESLGVRVALISVGTDNDYGHPAASTLTALQRAGLQVHRTDREGDLAVTVSGSGELATVVSGSPPRHGAGPAIRVRPP